jgi:hypothetical protein
MVGGASPRVWESAESLSGIQEPHFVTRIGVGYTLPPDRIPSDPKNPSAA